MRSLSRTVTTTEARHGYGLQDLAGDASSPHDFGVLLMIEFKNMTAFDGMRAKLDSIADRLIGGEDAQREGAVKRMEIREVIGDKLIREITLNNLFLLTRRD